MALLDPSVDAIATVGSFGPAFRKFSDVDVRVIERGDVVPVSTPDDVGVTTFQPAEAIAAMADADVVAGADVVALDRVRDALRQGACGTDLHDAGVRKVYTVADGVADPDGGRGDRGDRTNL